MCFEIYKGEDDKHYWRLWTPEGIIATGHQGYYTVGACRSDIEKIMAMPSNTGYCQGSL